MNSASEQAVELLAIELHKDYRASFKALHSGGLVHSSTAKDHDHGWQSCNRKSYFRKRAAAKLRKAQIATRADILRQIRELSFCLPGMFERRQRGNSAEVSGAGNTEVQMVVEARHEAGRCCR